MSRSHSPYDGSCYGTVSCPTAGSLPRHRHAFGYICVVVKGTLVEAGDAGRFRAAAGDVLVHRPFEGHLDVFGPHGADVLNLPLPSRTAADGRFRLRDVDRVVVLAERNPSAAAAAACDQWTRAEGEKDWPDELARDLRRPGRIELRAWADAHGLAPETLSRGFRKAYGVTPIRFAAEARARRAWEAVRNGQEAMAALALGAGFSDQAHMSRAVRDLTGRPPQVWRRKVNCVQDEAQRAT